MLRSFKKFVSLILVLALSLVVSLPAFADSNTKDVKDSGIKDSAITYIPEADAVFLANQCIKEQIGNDCPWTKSTKISETADLFDFEGNVNAYLFRLTTGGKRSGYVFVNASAKAPSVEAFGYDCDFMLDAMQKSDGKSRVTTAEHIIFCGALSFLNQNSTSGKYSVVGDKSAKIDSNKADLVENYKAKLQANIDTVAQANMSSMKTGSVKNSIKVSYVKPCDIHGINASGYKVYVTNDFPGYSNHCAPTAATNLVYYWSHQGSPREPKLWTGGVFKDLYQDMGTDSSGTMDTNIIPGIDQFASSRNAPISDYSADGVDWDLLMVRITNSIPVIITVRGDPKYGDHAMLAIGYKENSSGQYIRVEDGRAASVNNFYRFSENYMRTQLAVWW